MKKGVGTMESISVINTIKVPKGMEAEAEEVRNVYVSYFKRQPGFVSSSFYKSIEREKDDIIKYINIVVWESLEAFNHVVNQGFSNDEGKNSDGYKVLGKGFQKPIEVSPGRFVRIAED